MLSGSPSPQEGVDVFGTICVSRAQGMSFLVLSVTHSSKSYWPPTAVTVLSEAILSERHNGWGRATREEDVKT